MLLNVLVALGAEEKAATTKAADATKADEGSSKTVRQALFARNDYAAPGGYYNNFQHAGNNYNNDYQGRSYGGGGGGYYDRYNTNGGGGYGGGYSNNNYNSNGYGSGGYNSGSAGTNNYGSAGSSNRYDIFACTDRMVKRR